MIYLCSPYSHPSLSIRESRFRAVCRAAARMMAAREFVFSPIAHSHNLAMAGSLPTDFEFWRKYDLEMLSTCSSLRVLKLDGWEESKGIAAEVWMAKDLGLPVEYIDPIEEDLR